MKKIIFILIVAFVQNLFAAGKCASSEQADKECCELGMTSPVTSEKTNIVRFERVQEKVCELNLSKRNAEGINRRFDFANDGKVTVVVSNPTGNKAVGRKSFYFFPMGKLPNYSIENDKNIIIKSGSGMKWKFDSKNSLPTSIDGCNLDVSKKFTTMNSGIKIESCENFLILDTPDTVGMFSHITYPEKISNLRDKKGRTCPLENRDLFKHSGKGKNGLYDRAILRFNTNEELAQFLKKKCAPYKLDLSPLTAKQNNSEEDFANRKIDPIEEQRVKDLLESGGVE